MATKRKAKEGVFQLDWRGRHRRRLYAVKQLFLVETRPTSEDREQTDRYATRKEGKEKKVEEEKSLFFSFCCDDS